MPFFLHALLLALASFAPQASAVIVVVHHSGLSDTTRIVIICVAIGLFLLLTAFRPPVDRGSVYPGRPRVDRPVWLPKSMLRTHTRFT
ncbi:hypothetical protein C8R44DRAFT_22080 [Mycena epipterygia]|nr:hypothetical protein C8R44DRAFT_22080 [Mycena epipterygia]